MFATAVSEKMRPNAVMFWWEMKEGKKVRGNLEREPTNAFSLFCLSQLFWGKMYHCMCLFLGWLYGEFLL